MTHTKTVVGSAWREPMVWMLIALPILSVLVSTGLIMSAYRGGGESEAEEGEYSQHAKQQRAVDHRNDAAVALGMIVRTKEGGVIEVLPTDAHFPRGGVLTLSATPDHADAERRFELSPSDLGWKGRGSLQGPHDWILQLAPADAAWRLYGRWTQQTKFVRLKPTP